MRSSPSPPATAAPTGPASSPAPVRTRFTHQRILDAEQRLLHATTDLDAPTTRRGHRAPHRDHPAARPRPRWCTGAARRRPGRRDHQHRDLRASPRGPRRTRRHREDHHAARPALRMGDHLRPRLGHRPGPLRDRRARARRRPAHRLREHRQVAPRNRRPRRPDPRARSSTGSAHAANARSPPATWPRCAPWARPPSPWNASRALWALRPGQLLIVDEASLAGTFTLDTLTAQATAAGAKVLLVGDHRQLSAVDAGGAFGLLAEHGAARELRSLWRFRHRWEAGASRLLRHGHPSVVDTYATHDRIRAGEADTMVEAAYQAWQRHTQTGQSAVLLATDAAHRRRPQRPRARRPRRHRPRRTRGHPRGRRRHRRSRGHRAHPAQQPPPARPRRRARPQRSPLDRHRHPPRRCPDPGPRRARYAPPDERAATGDHRARRVRRRACRARIRDHDPPRPRRHRRPRPRPGHPRDDPRSPLRRA